MRRGPDWGAALGPLVGVLGVPGQVLGLEGPGVACGRRQAPSVPFAQTTLWGWALGLCHHSSPGPGPAGHGPLRAGIRWHRGALDVCQAYCRDVLILSSRHSLIST